MEVFKLKYDGKNHKRLRFKYMKILNFFQPNFFLMVQDLRRGILWWPIG